MRHSLQKRILPVLQNHFEKFGPKFVDESCNNVKKIHESKLGTKIDFKKSERGKKKKKIKLIDAVPPVIFLSTLFTVSASPAPRKPTPCVLSVCAPRRFSAHLNALCSPSARQLFSIQRGATQKNSAEERAQPAVLGHTFRVSLYRKIAVLPKS